MQIFLKILLISRGFIKNVTDGSQHYIRSLARWIIHKRNNDRGIHLFR